MQGGEENRDAVWSRMRAAVPVAVAAAIAALGLFAVVPLTWDEAWNFLRFSSHGVRAAFGSAQEPNYHWLFSALQSLIPADAVWEHPPLLRAVNAVVAVALALVLYRLVQKLPRPALLATLLLFCSPLFTLYLCVARGYLLGTLLFLCAMLLRDRPWIAGLFAGLSCACVPTFGLALPGALLALDKGKRWRAAVAGAGVIVPASIAAHGTLAGSARWGLQWQGFLHALLAPAWPAHLLLAAAVLFLWKDRPKGLALGLLGGVATTLLAIAVLAFFEVADPPYPRNLLFVPLFAWLAVLLATRARPAVLGLLAAAAAMEAAFLIAALRPHGDPNLHPYLRELTPAPLVSSSFETLECDFAIAPQCELFARGRRVLPLHAVPDACASGSVRVPGQAIVLQPGSRLLCY
jgi:hypothetical protein